MPASHVTAGTIVLRQWDRAHGLRETPRAFSSLDELYALCLTVDAPEVIDRIIIDGRDADDSPRVLTFVFQSITVSPRREA
jgi:hypothetical protein